MRGGTLEKAHFEYVSLLAFSDGYSSSLMRSLEAEDSYPVLGCWLPTVCSARNEKGLLPPLMEAKYEKSKKNSSFCK